MYDHEHFDKPMKANDIAVVLRENFKDRYSDETIRRRASTVRKWIDWCLHVLN